MRQAFPFINSYMRYTPIKCQSATIHSYLKGTHMHTCVCMLCTDNVYKDFHKKVRNFRRFTDFICMNIHICAPTYTHTHTLISLRFLIKWEWKLKWNAFSHKHTPVCMHTYACMCICSYVLCALCTQRYMWV